MVLDIGSCEICNISTQIIDGGAHLRSESGGGKDSKSAGAQPNCFDLVSLPRDRLQYDILFTDGTAASNLDTSKSIEGRRASGDIWSHLPNHHNLGRICRNKL